MQSLSFTLFRNTELIPVLLVIALPFILFIFRNKKEELSEDKNKRDVNLYKESKKIRKLNNNDKLIILIITLVYGIISIWKLGSLSFPTTTWQASSANQTIILELPNKTKYTNMLAIYGEGDNNSNPDSFQLGLNELIVSGGNSLDDFRELTRLDKGSIYQYFNIEANNDFKYIKLESTNKNNTLSEIGFYDKESDSFLDVKVLEDEYKDSKYPAELIIDEQDKLVADPTYMDESFFDEIYHVRNGYEVANGQYMYYTVHPLLATNIIGLFIKIFGLSPFIWRLPGVIAGIMMVSVVYLILHHLFTNTTLSTLGTIIFTFDFMHITTSRIATLEPISVLLILIMFYYMLKYYQTSFYDTSLRVQFKYLFLCGLFMSLGIAAKWTACYGAVGLAILLFSNLYQRYKEYASAMKSSLPSAERIKERFPKAFRDTILVCFIFFIFMPLIIYFLSFIPDHIYREPNTISNLWKHNLDMYSYHANLKATHPFQSTWYQWLLDVRPVWYYIHRGNEYTSTIACFSHPLLTWIGLPSIVLVLYEALIKKNKDALFISIGILSNLLPWISFVDRCVFSYHFYPTSIFIALAIVYAAKELKLHEGSKRILYGFIIVYLIIYIMYMPIITGFNTSIDYIHMLEIFDTWSFG